MEFAKTHSIDVAVIVIYLAGSFGIGILASRMLNTSSDEEGFYLAGRRMPGWVNGISYAVTAMNADVAPLYCGLAVVIGLPVAWFYLSRFALAWLIVAMLFAVRWRALQITTGPEFYSLRFGGHGAKVVRVVSALIAVSINMIPWLGAGLLGMHKILAPVFGIESKLTTLMFVLPILLSYVWISGFAGVVVTDVLQSAVIVLASMFLLGTVLYEHGGPAGLAEAVVAAHPEEHGEILSVTPVPGHEVLAPLVVLAWLIVPTIGRGGSVDLEGQRLFSARNTTEAAKVPIWAAGSLFVMLLLLTLPTLGVLASRPEMYHAEPSLREETYGIMLQENLPVGVLGVALAALLASVMSTIDSHLNYGAQTIVNDVLRQLFPGSRLLDPSSRTCLWIGRLAMLGILAGGVGVMFAADSLFKIATIIAGMFASSAAFYWAQWWWWRVNFPSWVAAMVGGPVVYLTLGWLLPEWPWWQAQLAVSAANADTMAMLQAIISIALTSMIWVTAVLLFPPESEATLKQFYRRAAPLGAWGPVREKVIREQPSAGEREYPNLFAGGLAVACLGAIFLIAAVLGVAQLAVGQYATAALLAVGALIAGGAFLPLFRWHIGRMEESQTFATSSTVESHS